MNESSSDLHHAHLIPFHIYLQPILHLLLLLLLCLSSSAFPPPFLLCFSSTFPPPPFLFLLFLLLGLFSSRLIADGFSGAQTEAAKARLDAVKERLAKIENESAARKNDLDDAESKLAECNKLKGQIESILSSADADLTSQKGISKDPAVIKEQQEDLKVKRA